MFAATHPDRADGLVLVNSFPASVACAKVPWGAHDEDIVHMLDGIDTMWGRGYPPAEVLAPSLSPDDPFHEWAQRSQSRGASPTTARTIFEMGCRADICRILPSIRVPTLVMHSRGDRMADVQSGRYFRDHIPGATYVEMPGSDHPASLGDADRILDEVENMATGVRGAVDVDRVVTSVMFTDIVGSTERASSSATTGGGRCSMSTTGWFTPSCGGSTVAR